MRKNSDAPSNRSGTSYVIWRTPGAGFFSIITSTLARLHLAEKMNLCPVVDIQNYDSVYSEPGPVLGTRNVWEYYFIQPAGRNLEEVEETAVTNDGTWPKGYPYDMSASPIYKEMWHKYVRPNPVTQKFVDISKQVLSVSDKTLGVHFRGQDMRRAKGHRYPPTLKQTNDAIRWTLDNQNFDEIFLVTEGQQYVDYFRKKWGTRLNPSPSFRLRYRNSYAVNPYPRARHRYLLGLETLRDALLLAECGGLVCGRSNLSEAAIALARNPERLLIRITQGRNSFRPYIAFFSWYMRAALSPPLGGFPRWQPPS